MDIKAPAQASIRRGEVVTSRPCIARRDTQREAQLSPRQFEQRWHTGPFADVAEKRLGGIGPRLWTEGHEQLLRRMRMEGARISLDLAGARRDVTLANERHSEIWRKLHKTRDDNQYMREQLHQLEGELREAQTSLAEMDAMYTLTRERRQSRRLGEDKGKQSTETERPATPDLYPDRTAG